MFRRKNDYNNNKFYFNEAILIKYKVYRMEKRSSEEIKKMLLGFLENFAPSAAVCCELGNIFNEQGKVDAAKFWFESALKVAKQHPEDHVEYNEFCPYYGLAYCHFYYGNLKKAIDYSSRAIALFPNNQFAQRNHELYWKEYLKRERMKHNEKQ